MQIFTQHNFELALTYAPYVIAVASACANFLPHPEKTEGFLNKISKFVNALALNLDKIKKVG